MELVNLQSLGTAIPAAAPATSRQITAKNTLLFELTVDNRNAGTDFYVQLWDVAAAGDIGGANADAAPDFEVQVPATSFVPFSFNGGYQFHRGIYARAVTALGGSTLAGADLKTSGRMITPFPICS